jgi:bis(5'-nucleosyl)-tetraphosphatase (symmetrical)
VSQKRRVFIGDIQGCREELEALLEAVSFDPSADELHPVGDLVNRGPDSAGTLRLLQSLDAGGVLGNHDLHLLAASEGRREPSRRDTFHDVLEAEDRDSLLKWLAQRPFARGWDDILCVHAGLDPTWPDPAEDHLRDLDPYEPDLRAAFVTRVRYCAKDGRRPKKDDPPPEAPFQPWFVFMPLRARETRTLVFGHWSSRGLVERPKLRGLDTGCVWGGALTAWIAEEDRLVSVPAQRAYQSIG